MRESEGLSDSEEDHERQIMRDTERGDSQTERHGEKAGAPQIRSALRGGGVYALGSPSDGS